MAITQERRYVAAAALLDDCAALARLARAAAVVMSSDVPSVVALVGGRRLRSARRVGLFAASFNPLTRAHVTLVEAARQAAGLDAVVWVCAVASVDKERVERAALVDRLAQMRAFLAASRKRRGHGGDALLLLNRGLYVDEVRLVRTLLPFAADLRILVGYDKIVQIFDPRYYANRAAALQDLFALAGLLVAPRSGEGASELTALLAEPQNRPFAAEVAYLDVPPTFRYDSSTEVRALAATSSPDPAALGRLLPPEGVALALHTGAYRKMNDVDTYATRERWLDALATLPLATARRLLPLSQLVQWTLATDTLGGELRAWLDAPSDKTSAARHASATTLLALLGSSEPLAQ